LGRVIEVLIVKDQDTVLVHTRVDRRHLFLAEGPGQIDARNLSGETRLVEGAYGQGHLMRSETILLESIR
jgi:hypothetical protein